MARILDLFSGMGGLSLGFALALEGTEIIGLDIDNPHCDYIEVVSEHEEDKYERTNRYGEVGL